MASKRSDKGELIASYCKYFPEEKDLTLAKRIYNENRRRFLSVEQVRSIVRRCRGHHGEKNRQNLVDRSTIKPLTYDTRTNPKPFKEAVNTGAKVLLLDIETAPVQAYVWSLWKQNVAPNQIKEDWFCLTWAAKWLFEDKVFSGKITPKEVAAADDKRIMKGMWELVNEADIVIAHNGEKFDLPKLNSRFAIHRMKPPMPYQSIDTLKHIRKQFGFSSNRLDYVNKLLSLPRKSDTGGFELWVECLKGDKKALDEMEHYNVQDVRILEETYLEIRPWIKPHPNMGLFILDEKNARCPTCGSAELTEQGKPYCTTVNAFDQFRCDNCGAVGRKRTTKLDIKERRHILSSTPK
jgi:DNA polymerase elongation subunit (family B)